MTTLSSNVATPVVDNRDATPEDAEVLGRVYRRLVKLVKAVSETTKAISEGWFQTGDERIELRASRNTALAALDAGLEESWDILSNLPNGTVAGGGATPQTIGLEFFNRNLNRTLGKRMTATQAKGINKQAFAG